MVDLIEPSEILVDPIELMELCPVERPKVDLNDSTPPHTWGALIPGYLIPGDNIPGGTSYLVILRTWSGDPPTMDKTSPGKLS